MKLVWNESDLKYFLKSHYVKRDSVRMFEFENVKKNNNKKNKTIHKMK